MSAEPCLIEQTHEAGAQVLYLIGAWRLANVPTIVDLLRGLRLEPARDYIVDGSRLESVDTAAGFVLVRHLAELGCTSANITPRGFDPRFLRLLKLVRERMGTPPATERSERPNFVRRIGSATLRLGSLLANHVAFLGAVALETLALLRNPGLFRLRETVSHFESVCIDAIPIVMLVNFLIGVVLAYVLGSQAQLYGASAFVADGVGLAVSRELAPIVTSVIVAGRSGAAFTAQIGAMKLNDEIDAITTLGLSPIQVLVIPRLFALMLALPLLVFAGDIAGILGGMLICAKQLNISPGVFIHRVHTVLAIRHFVIGIAKAPVFAVFIGLIACRMGILAARDAHGVGDNTTSTVVQCIVWVIVLDAVFAVIFQQLGI